MKKIVACAAGALLLGAPAGANDSTAEAAAGGLVLTKSDAIDMVSEDLFVSADEVRVRYVFRNRTAKNVRTIVAFPLPDEDLAEQEYRDFAFPHDFVTKVDGKPVRVALERKLVGKDKRKTTYHWEQVFSAGRDLVVEHRYVPGTGVSVGTALVLPDVRHGEEGRAYAARYCTDATFLAGVDRLAARAGGAEAAVPEYRIAYVLKTGGNWRAPIGSFRLVVDKGAPENLVSFCAEGVRKISPTQFEVRHTNWRPDRDLDILIVAPRS